MHSTDEAFAKLYESTKQSVLRYITSKCLNICDIEDIYQETFLSAYSALSEGRQIENGEAFVIGIAKHCLVHHYTAAQRLKARISLSAGRSSDETADIGDDTDIEELVADRELFRKVFNEITSQPPAVQRIFYLHYFLGLSLAETAQTLGMTESGVKQLLYKAVRKLRRKYKRRDRS